MIVNDAGDLGARVVGRDRLRVGQHRVCAGDLAQVERVSLDPAAIDRRAQLRRGRPVCLGDRRAIGDLRWVTRLPVLGRIPAPQPGKQERDRVLPGAHMTDRAGLLAVACQARRRQLVERGALGPAGEERLADARPAIEALERPDVEVLARMRAGQDRDLCGLEVEGGDAARLDEREQPERLDRRAQRDKPVGIAQLADDPAGRVRLDDVTAMDALLDAVAHLSRDDRRHHPAAPSRPRRAGLGRNGRSGHDPRIPRRTSSPSTPTVTPGSRPRR